MSLSHSLTNKAPETRVSTQDLLSQEEATVRVHRAIQNSTRPCEVYTSSQLKRGELGSSRDDKKDEVFGRHNNNSSLVLTNGPHGLSSNLLPTTAVAGINANISNDVFIPIIPGLAGNIQGTINDVKDTATPSPGKIGAAKSFSPGRTANNLFGTNSVPKPENYLQSKLARVLRAYQHDKDLPKGEIYNRLLSNSVQYCAVASVYERNQNDSNSGNGLELSSDYLCPPVLEISNFHESDRWIVSNICSFAELENLDPSSILLDRVLSFNDGKVLFYFNDFVFALEEFFNLDADKMLNFHFDVPAAIGLTFAYSVKLHMDLDDEEETTSFTVASQDELMASGPLNHAMNLLIPVVDLVHVVLEGCHCNFPLFNDTFTTLVSKAGLKTLEFRQIELGRSQQHALSRNCSAKLIFCQSTLAGNGRPLLCDCKYADEKYQALDITFKNVEQDMFPCFLAVVDGGERGVLERVCFVGTTITNVHLLEALVLASAAIRNKAHSKCIVETKDVQFEPAAEFGNTFSIDLGRQDQGKQVYRLSSEQVRLLVEDKFPGSKNSRQNPNDADIPDKNESLKKKSVDTTNSVQKAKNVKLGEKLASIPQVGAKKPAVPPVLPNFTCNGQVLRGCELQHGTALTGIYQDAQGQMHQWTFVVIQEAQDHKLYQAPSKNPGKNGVRQHCTKCIPSLVKHGKFCHLAPKHDALPSDWNFVKWVSPAK